jgi:hypothetical protein
MGKCGRVPLAAEGQECLEARAEKVPCRRNRQPRPRKGPKGYEVGYELFSINGKQLKFFGICAL